MYTSNSTWRECPGVWSGSCSGREPSTWSATTSSTWKAEEVTIGMKKSTDARKKLRPAKTCQSVRQEGEGLWRRTDTKRMVPSLSAPTWKNSNCSLPRNSVQYIAIAEQTEELFWVSAFTNLSWNAHLAFGKAAEICLQYWRQGMSQTALNTWKMEKRSKLCEKGGWMLVLERKVPDQVFWSARYVPPAHSSYCARFYGEMLLHTVWHKLPHRSRTQSTNHL